MRLSVIIVNYNVKLYLEQCLKSVFSSSLKDDMEVFVVDNNSSDGSIDYLRTRFSKVKFISNNENFGFAKANNIAIKRASGQYILLLNPDTVVAEDTFQKCCDIMDERTDVGALGVKMIDAHGHFLPESKRGLPTPWVSLCKLFGLNKLFPNSKLFGRYYVHYLDKNEIHEVEVLAGAYLMFRSQVLDKVGLLDESFFMYAEDIDISYRVFKNGFKNLYFPTPIIHYKGESAYRYNPYYVKVFYNAMLIFFKKHFQQNNMLFLLAVKFGIVICGFLVFIRKSILKALPNDFFIKRKPVIVDLSKFTYKEAIKKIQLIGEQQSNVDCLLFDPCTSNAIGCNRIIQNYKP